jgi:demethylmenaquinone methyltransferase / 2-methoxy-6-polyprenyl-1,4-benzoquinol methylase
LSLSNHPTAGSLSPNPKLFFQQGDAQALPFPDNSMDLYTIAFGIRNVTRVQDAINEAYRVLRPGGRFMCLEFSKVNNPLLGPFYDWYSFNIIPALGEAVAKDRAAYQYLVESIRKFPDQDQFARMIRKGGFQHVTYTNFTFGVCAAHSGFKL